MQKEEPYLMYSTHFSLWIKLTGDMFFSVASINAKTCLPLVEIVLVCDDTGIGEYS